jgi:uncharacterized protein
MESKRDILVNAFKNAIISNTGNEIEKIILFGSYARNQQTKMSNIDFLILSSYRHSYFDEFFGDKISDSLTNLMLEYGLYFSYVAEHIDTFSRISDFYPLYKSIIKEGIVVYSK